MNESIGFLELTSIAKGIETADIIIKAADISLIFARPGCPGKFYILFSGQVGAVKASMQAGIASGEESVVDHAVIARIDRSVLRAIALAGEPGKYDSLGVMEFFSVTAAIYAADCAAKAADVHIWDVRLGTGIGGKSVVMLTGDVAAVRAAVTAGSAHEQVEGMCLGSVVIPHPSGELFETLY